MALRDSSRQRPGSSKGASPLGKGRRVRLDLHNEKEELQELNDRLATYIGRNHSREDEEAAQLARLREQQEADSSHHRSISARLGSELSEARCRLNRTAKEQARLELEVTRLAEELRDLRERNGKKEFELKGALARVTVLETCLKSKEVQLATTLSENATLENELTEVKAELTNVKSIASDAKAQLQDEKLQNWDLAHRARTLQEKLDFQKSLREKEIMGIKRHYEIKLKEIEAGSQKECGSKLAEALQQLRHDQYEQIKQYKEQLEGNFDAKLKNAQLAAAKSNEFAKAAKEELAEAKMRIDDITSELLQCRNKISTLSAKNQDLEKALDREKTVSQHQLALKEQEVAEIREKLQVQMEELGECLGLKLPLDMEINAYRKMLEGEERRFDMTPTPVSRRLVLTSGDPKFRGTKRRLIEPKVASRLYGTREHVFSTGQLILEEIDNEGKFIKIKNISDKDQPLGGWTIRREFPNLTQLTYKFPARFTLKSKQVVTIWAEGSDVVLVWRGQKSWGTRDDKEVVLLNANGEEMASWASVQIPGILGSESRDQDDEDGVEGSRQTEYYPKGRAENEDPSCSLISKRNGFF
ncbi:lamin-L(III)-like [Hemiscyllium ocellatum]|uniref:lamin-L(III)-like n=1 Tax=Hemiscyllium ocellatum TaxID=170820 RepID=UPI0029675292|nr:lamin-L(III)-like [Hemiscyllium ocellatum]